MKIQFGQNDGIRRVPSALSEKKQQYKEKNEFGEQEEDSEGRNRGKEGCTIGREGMILGFLGKERTVRHDSKSRMIPRSILRQKHKVNYRGGRENGTGGL